MAVPAQDALLEAPGAMRTILQHFNIVVGFQHQDIGLANPLEHQLRRMTQIGEETNVSARCPQQEAHRVLRIMRHGECFDGDVPDLEARAGGEKTRIQPPGLLILNRLLGGPIAIDGNAQLFAQSGQTLNMIGMLVRDQNAGQILRRPSNGGEAMTDLAQAEARINQDAGFFGFNVSAIAARTAAEDRHANRHG